MSAAEAREAWRKVVEAEADAKDWSKAAQALDQEIQRLEVENAELRREATKATVACVIDMQQQLVVKGLHIANLTAEADAWFELAQQYGEEKATLSTEVKTLRHVVHEANEEMNLVRDQMLLAEGMAALCAARVTERDAHLRVVALLRDRVDSITTSSLDEMRTQIIAFSNDLHDVLDGVKAWP